MRCPIVPYRVAVTALVLVALVGLSRGESRASRQIDEPGSVLKSTPQRAWDAQDRTPPSLSTIIEHFDVTDETVPSAVVRLANEHGVLCGLYVVPWPEAHTGTPEAFTSVSATFRDATVAQILDGLVALDRCFTWREDQGVINVALAAAIDDPTHPLNVRLALFQADEVPYLRALFGGGEWQECLVPGALFEEVYLVTGLLVGFGYSGPSPDLYPTVTISAEGWTTVQILNEMARQLRLPWYIVDRSMLGGRDIGFSMGVDLVPLPSGQPVARLPSQERVVLARQDTPCPCSTPAGAEATSWLAREAGTVESRSSALVPLRERLAANGFTFSWDSARQSVIARKGKTSLSVTADTRCACLNNVLLNLPEHSVIIDGRLHVPALLVDLTLSAVGHLAAGSDAGRS